MTRRDPILDHPILSLSETDTLLYRDCCEGVFISGSPGSGKSSCSGKQLALGLLSIPKLGALICTAKSEETRNWIEYARLCGRESDLIVFNVASGHLFDPLYYEWTRPGRGAGDLEAIIDLFSTLVSIGDKEGSGHSGDEFWRRGCEQLMRNVIKLLDLAEERISIVSIDRVIKSLPTRPNEYEEEQWQRDSYCAQLIASIRARQETLSPEQWSDLDFATQFIFRKWPAFDERPRSSLEMTWAGMADKFLFNPLNRLFCSGVCTFLPEQTMTEGKLVICDFPLLEYGHQTGRLINVMLKLIFQRSWLRRNLPDSLNPVMLWQDEMQYFIVPRFDNFFQQTCRGSRVAVVALTQNILNLSEALGESRPDAKTKSFLGNLAIKIFHQQNDVESCTYAADQIGKEYRYLDNYSGGSSSENNHSSFNAGASRQLAYTVEPVELTRLVKPDSVNPLAQALVYASGKIFNATITEQNPRGLNYLSVFFSR
jgi:hypothetical protein